jgi:hypothetical protein
MDETSEIEFHVDEQYENEKGVYTVVSMERDAMVIRWENGEEIRTDIELQRRIIKRRQREAAQRALEAEAAAKSKQPKRTADEKKSFAGLSARDFKNSASGTRWRSRNQLGGAVLKQMGASGLKFNSWAFGNKPEMHIQDTGHRQQGAVDAQAKFFVAVDDACLYYGFRVARLAKKADPARDWKAVMAWFSVPENDTMLRSLVAEEHLRISTAASPAVGPLGVTEDGWHKEDGDNRTLVSSLSAHLGQIPESDPCEVEIAAVVARDDAVAEGLEIASKIALLFTRLLPLYRAALSG